MIKYNMPKKIQRELPPIEIKDGLTVAERLTDIRKNRGYTQLELAERVGITREVLASYELGRARIYDEMIYRLATALDVTTDRILGKEERKDVNESISLRYTKRIKEIESLPEYKRRMVLKALDDSIKANKE